MVITVIMDNHLLKVITVIGDSQTTLEVITANEYNTTTLDTQTNQLNHAVFILTLSHPFAVSRMLYLLAVYHSITIIHRSSVSVS